MLLLIIILVLVFGIGPGYYGYNRNPDGSWPHAGGYGLGGILLVLLILYLLGFFGGGRLHF